MRLAPVVVWFQADEQEAVHFAAESSRTTHAAPQALDACRLFATLLVRAFNGSSKEKILTPVPLDLHPALAPVADMSCLSWQRAKLNTAGYCVYSLEVALWCFAHTTTFEEGCLMAANLGGDADTNAAIFGQIAGAFYGYDALPARWLERLAWRDRILALADQLAARGAA